MIAGQRIAAGARLRGRDTGCGSTSTDSRTAILDATEQIMREEGYAAVSSRKVASRAGLKSQLVHYYFKTMDELFLALFRRVEERHFECLARAVAAKAPPRAIWELLADSNSPRLTREFVALATHREYLRTEIVRSAERTRRIIVAVLSRAMADQALPENAPPPVVLAILMDGAARLIISESALGISAGHQETRDFIEGFLDRAGARTQN